MNIEVIFKVVIVAWLLGLSVFLFWLYNFFRRLTKDLKKGDLIKILEKVITHEEQNSKSIKSLEKEIRRIDNEMVAHVQKVGLVRFNPFKELGGDHSFALALLNDEDSGVILTGLHTRAMTRVYIKQIKKGKSKYKLATEENKALLLAQSRKTT